MLRHLLVVVVATLVLLGPAARSARADERAERLRERVELIRKLPREEQQRLREALERFRALPKAERTRIRERASTVGDERLRELVGRDVRKLRRRHDALDREKREILRLLGGEERFRALSPVEKRYVMSLAVRNFQKHVRRTLLTIAGPQEMEAFNRLTRAERREKMEAAIEELEANLLAAETPEYRATILALPPGQQRKARRKLLADHRLTLVQTFVSVFERQRLDPFLRLPADARREAAERWDARARWFEMRRRLEREVGVTGPTLNLLAQLEPEDWSRVRDEYDRTATADLTPEQRRLRLEEEIRALHGRSALGEEARSQSGRGRLRRMLRNERRRRHGAEHGR